MVLRTSSIDSCDSLDPINLPEQVLGHILRYNIAYDVIEKLIDSDRLASFAWEVGCFPG